MYVCAIHIILIYQVEHRRFNEPKNEIPITYGLMARLVLSDPDYDEDENELEEKRKKETGEQETTNQVF